MIVSDLKFLFSQFYTTVSHMCLIQDRINILLIRKSCDYTIHNDPRRRSLSKKMTTVKKKKEMLL